MPGQTWRDNGHKAAFYARYQQRAPADRIARRFVAILMAEAIAVAPPGDRNTRRSSRPPARQQR